MKLQGKTAIVTGAGSGIGQAIALAFAREGANVVVADVDMGAAQEVAGQIASLGGQSQAVKVDVSNADEVNHMVKKSLDRFGKIDILVNNAGILSMVSATELSESQWDRIMDINLKGQFLCSQAVGKEMLKQKQGRIVNIASASGHVAAPGQAAYCASKAGVILLTKALAVEWARYGITVNSVSPARTLTPLFEKALRENPEAIGKGMKRIPTGRANRPEDIANVVLFLASPESANITGEDILIDGGACALFSAYVYPEE